MRIAQLRIKPNHVLYIVADDGRVGCFDVSPYLQFETFVPLRDPIEFEKILNGGYFVEWECGADLSADTIFAEWKILDRNQSKMHP